jgi:transposase
MPRRGEAVHVATTQRHYKGKVYKTHLLRRTYRQGGKVKHQTLGNLSHLPEHLIELIRRALRGEAVILADEAFEIERSLPHGHVAAVLGTVRQLGLDRLVASKRSRERDLVVAMLVARLIDPRSKLATARGIDGGTSTLADVLELGTVDEDELYDALDWLLARQGKIEAALAQRHLTDGTLVLCDVSSTYFEGRTCPLARFGKSRDGKRDKLQIVFALLVDPAGRPVAVEVFEGNTGDPTTLAPQLEKLQERFGLQHLVVVGDRGLVTEARIREELRPRGTLGWITALRAPAIRKLVDTGSIQLSLFDERDLAEIHDPDFPGERLIVCKNPLLAEERTRKREDLLAATERELEKVAVASRRQRQPLRGKEVIGLRVGRVLGRFKMGKHYRLTIEEERFAYERDEVKIAEEAALDGIYVLRTSVPAETLAAEQTVAAYKNLSKVERAFRSLKTVDLKIRPIYHHLADRVRAHVFLCLLAYYVEWHLRERLAPLLFDEEDPAAAASRRSSVVAPAQRSERTLRKVRSRKTEDGFAVHSFQDLLRNLSTLCQNRVVPKLPGAPAFTRYTIPTPLQQRGLDLLGVSLQM